MRSLGNDMVGTGTYLLDMTLLPDNLHGMPIF